MGKGGIVFYFWGADATEKGSLGPNTVVNSNQKIGGFREAGGLRERSEAVAGAELRPTGVVLVMFPRLGGRCI